MKPKKGKSQKDTGALPFGARRTWHNHYDSVDFMKNKGALYGVKIVIPLDNANKLSKALKQCITLAKKHEQEKVEIDAHFGAKGKEGFKLDVRIRRLAEQD